MGQPQIVETPDLSQGMHAIITGSGSALIDPGRGGASAAVVIDGTVLQFDCGRKVMENLTLAGVNPVDVETLFLTHLHFDHIASFGYFIISNWIASRQKDLQVLGPPGTAAMADGMVFHGHHVDVGYVRGLVASWPDAIPGKPRSDPPFAVRELAPGLVLERPGFTVRATPVPHFQHLGVESLGYRVDSRHGSVVITGDCRPNPEITALAQGADVMIHDCSKPDGDMLKSGKLAQSTTMEAAKREHTNPHTTPSWLGAAATDARVKMVVATHLAPLTAPPAAFAMSKVYYGHEQPGPQIWAEYERRIRATFAGDVVLARDAMVIKVG